MEPQRYRQIMELVADLMEQPEAKRYELLKEASAGDETLYQEVLSLLNTDEKTLLDKSVLGPVQEFGEGDQLGVHFLYHDLQAQVQPTP